MNVLIKGGNYNYESIVLAFIKLNAEGEDVKNVYFNSLGRELT